MRIPLRTRSAHPHLPTAALAYALVALALVTSFVDVTRAASLDGDQIFAPKQLLEIEIEMPEEDWTALSRQTRSFGRAFAAPATKPFTYFKGDIVIDGHRIESVGIRKKGFIGSLDEQRPSLKIKFDEYQDTAPIKRLSHLTLNNNKQDEALVSQFLTYKLFNAAGVHAPRCNFARVTVNGEYLGIYSNVESIKKPFLTQRFGDGSGKLFEGTLADFYPKSIDRLEAKNKQAEEDRSRPQRLAEILTSENEPTLSQIEQLVDVNNFLTYWAVESLIGFWDGYTNNQNNFYVYDNPANGKFYFVPWGADGAFTGSRGPFARFGGPETISVYAQGMLANHLYHVADMPDRYRQAMLAVLDKAWKEEELLKDVAFVEELVKDKLHERQRNVPRAMSRVRDFVSTRREKILKEFEDWPVDVAPEPRKPMYTVEVGSAVGKFVTKWQAEPADDPGGEGVADLRLILDGQVVELDRSGAAAHPARAFGFGRGPGRGGRRDFGRGDRFRRPPGQRPADSSATTRSSGGESPRRSGPPAAPPRRPQSRGNPFAPRGPQASLVLAGAPTSGEEPFTITLTLSRDKFAKAAGNTLDVQGRFAQGRGGFGFGPRGMRSVSGTLRLLDAGVDEGDLVSGELELKVIEMRGGFFGGRRGPGRGPGRTGPPGRGAERPQRPTRPE